MLTSKTTGTNRYTKKFWFQFFSFFWILIHFELKKQFNIKCCCHETGVIPNLLFYVRKNPFFTSSSGFVLSLYSQAHNLPTTMRIPSNDVIKKIEKGRTYDTFKKVFILSSFWVPWKKWRPLLLRPLFRHKYCVKHKHSKLYYQFHQAFFNKQNVATTKKLLFNFTNA